ncbi:hypothetical protein M5K25_027603 [Dendrobium thyrsiflorum]|uniref:Uncharacterized protein n=1 Tax=Dendrobium thyrsiflorum TaxID=117978 RepID=A0ABD0TUE1_DENTH
MAARHLRCGGEKAAASEGVGPPRVTYAESVKDPKVIPPAAMEDSGFHLHTSMDNNIYNLIIVTRFPSFDTSARMRSSIFNLAPSDRLSFRLLVVQLRWMWLGAGRRRRREKVTCREEEEVRCGVRLGQDRSNQFPVAATEACDGRSWRRARSRIGLGAFGTEKTARSGMKLLVSGCNKKEELKVF